LSWSCASVSRSARCGLVGKFTRRFFRLLTVLATQRQTNPAPTTQPPDPRFSIRTGPVSQPDFATRARSPIYFIPFSVGSI